MLTIEFKNEYYNKAALSHNQREVLDHLLREYTNDVAQFGEGRLRFHAPEHTGLTKASIFSSRAERIMSTIPTTFQAEVGIHPMLGRPGDFLRWITEGTGLYAGRGLIYATHGNVMVFTAKDGKKVFTRTVKGQRPNPWVRLSKEETKAYFILKKQELKIKMLALF